jgi:hypothetical protein
MNSQLIIRLQNENGFSCEQFENLPSPRSVYLAICFTDNAASETLAKALKEKLTAAIKNLGGDFEKIQAPPCMAMPNLPFNHCEALSVNDNIKLLLVVGDGSINVFADGNVLTWQETALPVLPSNVSVNLPHPFDKPQVAFWDNDIDEVIPAIFGLMGISDEDLRIFISYRRKETSPFAEQLFDRLHREGFEVFLDKFSIRPSVNFQNRLYQELADKVMVVFLESETFLESPWIQLEVDFAKTNELGALAVNIGGAQEIPSVDEDNRIKYSAGNFNSEGELETPEFDDLIKEIKRRHAEALYFRKHYLNENVVKAIQSKGATEQFDKFGFIHDGVKAYRIWTTPRPPKLDDFYYADIFCPKASRKIIFGPKFMEDKRRILNDWLKGKAMIEFYNEGQLLELAGSL